MAVQAKEMGMFKLRLWAVLMILIFAWLPASYAADNIQVIVNAASATRELSRPLLRAIFSMRMREFPDGTPVTVFVLPDRDERHREFCKDVLEIYPYILRDTWDRLVFTGTGQTPTEVATQEELIRRVAATRGGIGYISQEGKGSYERIRILDIY